MLKSALWRRFGIVHGILGCWDVPSIQVDGPILESDTCSTSLQGPPGPRTASWNIDRASYSRLLEFQSFRDPFADRHGAIHSLPNSNVPWQASPIVIRAKRTSQIWTSLGFGHENQNMEMLHPMTSETNACRVKLKYALFPFTCGPSQGRQQHRPPANRPAVRTHAAPGCHRAPAMTSYHMASTMWN